MDRPSIAIACATGGFKGVFLHGVLSAFENEGFKADAYAAASSSVLPAAAAAIGRTNDMGLSFWQDGLQLIAQPNVGMSQMVLKGITRYGPWIHPYLASSSISNHKILETNFPRFMIAANQVDALAAEETQGKGGRRRGRLLLLAAARGDREWVDAHLRLKLFDTAAEEPSLRLTAENFDQVAYASSRMLHAWDIPAWIDDRPFIDAFYTCACPAVEMAEKGIGRVIALATEPVLYRDIFQDQIMPKKWKEVPIHTINPDMDPAQHAVNYTTATEEGLKIVYNHGLQKGHEFLTTFKEFYL
jgi:hypothetical protein